MDRSYSLTYSFERVFGQKGPVTPPGPEELIPLTGYLDAANIIVLGASIMAAEWGDQDGTGKPKQEILDYATGLGYTATFWNRAQAGDTVSNTLSKYTGAIRDEFAATRGNNLYLIHTGGNNVDFQGYPPSNTVLHDDYDALLAAILADGDKVVASSLTFRSYNATSGDASTAQCVPDVNEQDGSAPYNDNILIPLIASHLPDWMNGDRPWVDLYEFTKSMFPLNYDNDGTHIGGPKSNYMMTQVAKRALAQTGPGSRSGKAFLFVPSKDYSKNSTIEPFNILANYNDNYARMPGAMALDGSVDYWIEREKLGGSGQTQTGATDAGAYDRLEDPRFHDDTLCANCLYWTATTGPVTFTFYGLTPGDTVQVKAFGSRSATTGTIRKGLMTLNGSEALVIDAAINVASNQVNFTPITVPADGTIALSYAVNTGATYAHLNAILLDFL